jgi:hypothetical protein
MAFAATRECFVLFCASTLFLGCRSTQRIPEAPVALRLDAVQTRRVGDGFQTVQFPVGIYKMAFQLKNGTYYAAEGKFVVAEGKRIVAGVDIREGGIFVPFKHEKDRRQGFWRDDPGEGGIYIFVFAEPLQFEWVESLPQASEEVIPSRR